MMSPTKTAILLAPLILTFLFGCQSAVDGTSEIGTKIDRVYPVLAIETGRLPAASVSDFARERMAGLIGTRLRASPHNPFESVYDTGQVKTESPGESSPRPTLIARLTFIRYDQFGDAWATEFDPFYRIKIVGVLDLVDSETQKILLSRRLVRALRLRGFDDLSGFNRSRSPLLGRRHVHIHGFGDESSKVRLLERAFASAVVRELLAHVPSPPNAF